MIPVFDSNILIDHLSGRTQAVEELQRYENRIVSIVTWIEVMVGIRSDVIKKAACELFDYFIILDVTAQIAERTVQIRQKHRLALPDAIIWATAKAHNTLLITRNTKDFPPDLPDIRVPYTL